MKLTFATCAFCLFGAHAMAQEISRVALGPYAGVHVGHLRGIYEGDLLPGWKVGLAATSFVKMGVKASAQMGLTFDRARPHIPWMPTRTEWRYLWADLTPGVSFAPIRKSNFAVGAGTGISIRRIVGTNVHGDDQTGGTYEDRVYKWSYFLPLQVSVDFFMAKGRRVTCVLSYDGQLRPVYQQTSLNAFDYANYIKFESYGIIIIYSLPVRSNKA